MNESRQPTLIDFAIALLLATWLWPASAQAIPLKTDCSLLPPTTCAPSALNQFAGLQNIDYSSSREFWVSDNTPATSSPRPTVETPINNAAHTLSHSS